MNGGNGGIGNQPDRFFTGGVSGNGGQGNFNVSNNGTAANRLRNIDCIAIEMQVDGPVTMTSTVQNNFINANSAVGCAGIAVGTDDPNDLGAGTHSDADLEQQRHGHRRARHLRRSSATRAAR